MHISLNGESYQLAEGSSIEQLLIQLEFVGKRVAVEVNQEIVPRSQHSQTLLNEGDQVEVVQAIGGG